ncbi:uncharacterized protein LOC106129915 [Amyelois transitella]|uniref:uncharacterized protein LOC106129915 n=1 Tax=Amyelois transitella TaxID=680683 RepID=UPI00067D3B0E|nr:uncharacterized protein LOC106129915 [Amyelois transitella]
MADMQNYQKFLDQGQYSKHGLEKYEWIFGETFLSTGGITTTMQVLKHVQLGENPKVLDVGSGLGGHSFLFAEKYGAEVLGLDLSENMLEIARKHLDKRPHLKDKVRFEFQDCTKIDYPENSFDLVYSRDALIHIRNKTELFKKIYKWLKPNGYVLFTDYVRGEDERMYTEEFKMYLKNRDYDMATITEYREVLEKSGFKRVQVEDWKDQFKYALEIELDKLQGKRLEFLQHFTQADYEDLESGWLNKVFRANEGNQGWILGVGRKLGD